MTLVRWEPALSTEMNRFFNSFFDTPTTRANAAARRWVPAMDLVESAERFVLTADLPGLKSEDVTIEVEDGVLTVSGERKVEQDAEQAGVFRRERATGRFRRSLTLPEGVEAGQIEASFEDGVLEIRIPKPAAKLPQKVEIGIGSKSEQS